jgi:hypothetical protein
MNSYIGYMWYDEESDGKHMYPAKQKDPTHEELIRSMLRNPNESADRGNLSDRYYPLPPGYAYLAPVLGLLAYDAANLSAAGLPELSLVASTTPILVTFSNFKTLPSGGPAPRCVWFDLDGAPQFRDPEASGNVCAAYRGGHFSIAVNSTEVAPAPASPAAIAPLVPGTGGRATGNSQAWKIAGTVVGSAAALGLLASALLCLVRYKRVRKLEVMERNSEVGETLRMAQVGRASQPVRAGAPDFCDDLGGFRLRFALQATGWPTRDHGRHDPPTNLRVGCPQGF